ncbi:MAG: B12-binding radical protein [Bacteroidota bacterium]|nr:B12-binding radical protein [Bacteroidota bacterium]
MNTRGKHIILFDLPTYPKGTVSLSLPAVAAFFANKYEVKIIDLNFEDISKYKLSAAGANIAFFGFKVSSQNISYAKTLSAKLKTEFKDVPVVWGGELPTILPELCLETADTIVQKTFETVATRFEQDLALGSLQKIYIGENIKAFSKNELPRLDLIGNPEKYSSFMGLPLETSRGCTETCTFCMVHNMQAKNYFTKDADLLKNELTAYKDKFINIIDYNFGVDAKHVIDTAEIIRKSGALGWMAEMCIELLDNEDVLKALGSSRCKMIYCGLETIDEQALKSVHKMNTNHIANYERIIRKAQSYGVQIASGFILGMDGTKESTFKSSFDFFQRMGIIYVKLTFLTYNPGTKVSKYMAKKGTFVTEDISYYDGNHISYLPTGVNAMDVMQGTEYFINRFYSLPSIISRSFNSRLGVLKRMEFILFNLCYRQVYLGWMKSDFLHHPDNFKTLVEQAFTKSVFIKSCEGLLNWVRKMQMN